MPFMYFNPYSNSYLYQLYFYPYKKLSLWHPKKQKNDLFSVQSLHNRHIYDAKKTQNCNYIKRNHIGGKVHGWWGGLQKY